ncbi:MAG: F0F1 ATP synthase subunit gamma, partial [Thermodesulfobacteriota bacterium]|nr:F0F1 ATP synthase subunit gamma [Thermodesulfobacteriota bacterium]
FTNFGKKGRDWCRRNNFSILGEHLGIVGAKFGFNIATVAGKRVVDGFLDEEYDEVYIIYSEFISMAKQTPIIQQILPIQPIGLPEKKAEDEETPYLAEHICEPSTDELLGDMLPRHIYVQLYSALLETSTSEHAARMTAMNNATKACDDMVESLSLAYNKARQSSITADLMDIVGGAEALKG